MNASKCLECGDVIRSIHRHDFRSCTCENIFVDGGEDYRRIGWMTPDSWVDITTDEDFVTHTNTTHVLEDEL